jgi:asparagine synthase (glutamine-hydrolysing)
VPEDRNLGRIADVLDDLEHFSLSETFYAAVSRLPPAHCLILDDTGLRLRKYWRLETAARLKLKTDSDYVEAFLDVFTTAVRSRLRSAGQVGAMLSGGMDSSSVVAVAADILKDEGGGPLQTFSAIGPDPGTCPETRAIHAAARIKGIEAHYVSYADLGAYRDELLRLTVEAAEPFDTHMMLPRAVYLAAHRAAVKVVLDGVAGDVALYSDSLLARLLRRGRFVQAWQEATGERQVWGPSWPLWKSLGMAAGRAWVPRPARLLRRRASWWWRDRQIGRWELISRDFAKRTKLVERRRQLRVRDSNSTGWTARNARGGSSNASISVGRERYDRVASALAVEPRDPFVDLRVLDFCLSLPWEQLQSGGWPKLVLRRSMAGTLPDEVCWRQGKEHLGGAFIREILGPLAASAQSFEDMRETIAPYVDLQRLNGSSCDDRINGLSLHHWLASATFDKRR